jgi:hypothetical protein
MRAARVACLSHADVSKGQQPCHQITSLKVRVEAYDGIVLRVVAQLKVECLCHPLQDKRYGCVTRDEMHPGSTIAPGDSYVLGHRYWSRQEHNRAKPDTEGRIHDQTTDAAFAPGRRPQFILACPLRRRGDHRGGGIVVCLEAAIFSAARANGPNDRRSQCAGAMRVPTDILAQATRSLSTRKNLFEPAAWKGDALSL